MLIILCLELKSLKYLFFCIKYREKCTRSSRRLLNLVGGDVMLRLAKNNLAHTVEACTKLMAIEELS